MRLLHTETLEFKEFFNPPEYAILSHRWGADEITYEQYLGGKNLKGRGYEKIVDCCKLARSRGRKYVWIDTCCIDKRSSAELSEATNSMWRWYAGAQECYDHLSDVDAPEFTSATTATTRFNTRTGRTCGWFRRGWTLQELLAPDKVIFCASDWQVIGTKADPAIRAEVSDITSIPEDGLRDPDSLSHSCVAEKLSWAARRVTTREEDNAYCLLGLLGINMPLLYGEGRKASLRLQQEILRQTDDESIFAWRYRDEFSDRYRPEKSGVLAHRVRDFRDSGSVRLLQAYRDPYTLTNKGLDWTAACSWKEETGTYIVPLNCVCDDPATGQLPARCCLALGEERGTGLFLRTNLGDLGQYLPQHHATSSIGGLDRRFIIRLWAQGRQGDREDVPIASA